MEHSSSPFEGFSKLSLQERQQRLAQIASLSSHDLSLLSGLDGSLNIEKAEHFIENVVGLFQLPLGIATNFLIDGRDLPIPMVVEETSIVAAASSAAKWVRRNGGFKTEALGRLIIGQIQFPTVKNPSYFSEQVAEYSEELIAKANGIVPNLVARGGGVRDLKVRTIDRPDGGLMAVIHVLCDPCDAMGANLINQICEGLKPELEHLTKEKVGLCILSNLVDTKLVQATCVIADIQPELGRAIAEATLFANLDPYRGTTHNKGVMNGIDPILIATGNDWRAVEAGMHAYTTLGGKYKSITDWHYRDGKLYGKLVAPIVVGTVGGVTKSHPTAQLCLKMLKVTRAEDLSRICAATGLAQNLAALRALCGEGIIKGHMRLHSANLAISAGAQGHEVQAIQDLLKNESRITATRAKELLAKIRLEKLCIAMKFSSPGKVFILGEYACIFGGPSLIATTAPHFELRATPQIAGKSELPFHIQSPAGLLAHRYPEMIQSYAFSWTDPYQTPIGVGSSSAQFLLMLVAICKIKKLPLPPAEQILNLYWEIVDESQGIPPSGVDVLAQLLGGARQIQNKPFHEQKLPVWKNEDAIFLLGFTGSKVKTHEHLQDLKNRGFPNSFSDTIQKLSKITLDGIDSWKKMDAVKLGLKLNAFQSELHQSKIAPQGYHQKVLDIQSIDGVFGAKGSGAQGGDCILLLVEKSKVESIQKTLVSKKIQPIPLQFSTTGLRDIV